MPALLDRIATRLDRLRSAPMAAKPVPVPAPAPPPELEAPAEPLTMEALQRALGELQQARQEQQAVITGAEAERDHVLDDEAGDDAEILEIDRRVALARLSLDRLGRLEEEAFNKLRPLQEAAQATRWVQARDQYVLLMQDVYSAMQTFEIAANRLWAHRSALFNPVGAAGWDDQVPKLPHFAKAAVGGAIVYASNLYAAEAERFSRVTIGSASAAQTTLPERLSRFIEGKITPKALVASAAMWGAQEQSVADHPVLVRLTRSITMPDGEALALGAGIKVTARHARELVAANRAILTDTLTNVLALGKQTVGADLPLRELPLPPAPSSTATPA